MSDRSPGNHSDDYWKRKWRQHLERQEEEEEDANVLPQPSRQQNPGDLMRSDEDAAADETAAELIEADKARSNRLVQQPTAEEETGDEKNGDVNGGGTESRPGGMVAGGAALYEEEEKSKGKTPTRDGLGVP